MLFKTRFKRTDTPSDSRRKQLTHTLWAALDHLEDRTENVIVRKGVVNLYPDGPDKDRAKHDLEKAKYSLLCAITTADTAKSDLICFINEHDGEFTTTIDWGRPGTESESHTVIENAWRNFFMRRK